MWPWFAIDKKILLYDYADVDFRDANVMSRKLMNRKLNRNGAGHLAPEMASGQEVQKRGSDSEDQKGGLDMGLLLDWLRADLTAC